MRMHLKYRKDGSILYGIGWTNRWMYALFSLVLAYGLISVILDQTFSTSALFPLFLLILGLLGMGYRERWVFDSHTGKITYTYGFYIFVRNQVFDSKAVRRVEILHFIRGADPQNVQAAARGRNKAMVVFRLKFESDRVKDVEILPERTSGGATERSAQAIASAMNLDFYADREPDTVQSVSIRDL